MTAKKISDALIHDIVVDAFNRERPTTQEACCAIAARVAVLSDDGPWTDGHIINVASWIARGLFGPAFDAADYGQKSAWVDMCERALRKAVV